ncbi:phenylalanine--tRNA ligase subunit beta [Candidatus Pantoea edessiphila]|uniref:Phenylalanine--tRNA ligase beta subunit n=1 Tax=Candidatus Pantoea edessiphila TaxID=2044610 RepID=A0A2P5T0L2_9GAMM|nr:phenylalanine--tRNA ligase subunit beta [Candidatus Pantoea edessiphila]PPI88134.1 phenylalanine--tRNA ligase subunit beta [Candidatus Pantoea edessiphila]
MKFSELWLREWVDLTLDSNTLCKQITMLGLEVENISSVINSFNDIVTGIIIECKTHSNADKLKLTKVNIGNGNVLNIICNSINCRVGLKVAVAPIGAILPGDKKVKEINVHGNVSEGIICSFSTLGISNIDDLIELPSNMPIGKNAYNFLNIHDNIIEVNITPNRADCFSIIGIARDIAALNCLSLKQFINKPIPATINDILSIYINEVNSCPIYLTRIIKDIDIKVTTPLWIKEKLRRCGIASVNILTDINNYILMEIGQPIQTFDLDHIDGYIVVRMAREGEVLTLIDNKKIKLNPKILVIADKNKILSLAGICEGFYANISNQTKNILLGSAYFNPLSIINNVRFYNLNSEASHRYERGVDYKLQYKAIEYATKLIIDICNGKAGPITDYTNYKSLPSNIIIDLNRKKLDRLVGFTITDTNVSDILTRLGFCIYKKNGKWIVTVPSWRFDILLEEDLIEEIIRIFGYENIPNIPATTQLVITEQLDTNLLLKRIKNFLVDKGYQEVITYSFVDPKLQKLLHPNQNAVPIINPISQDMSVMRLSLWTGLINILIYNQNYQQNKIRLFESGYCFIPNKKFKLGVGQKFMIAGILSGNISEEHWDFKPQLIDFYDLKGDLESLFELSNNIKNISFHPEVNLALHPGKSAAIYLCDKKIGFIGAIHPNIQNKLKIKNETLVFELFWNELTSYKPVFKVQEISRFPINRRDISIIVDEIIPAEDIIALCKKIGINQLVGINLLDVYRGKGISKGYKSLTMSLILQDTKRTLKEEEIAIIVNKYIMALKEKFQVTLRN